MTMMYLIFSLISFVIRGVVIDENKVPLPYASVIVANTTIGTATDENGKFRIIIPDSIRSGKLKVSYIGYREKVVPFNSRTKFVKIVLTPLVIKESPVVVKGSFSASQTEGITISKFKFNMMDIYTTPGTAADVFLTIKTIPSFSGDPDVATLTIRGGEPDETLIMLNGLRLRHPYIYSISEHGGLFSIIPTSAIGQVEAFAGVLPPAYGGKASGGVILKTLDVSDISLKSLTLISGGISLNLIEKNYGGVWTNLSSYKIMAQLNGIDTKYSIYPFYGSIFYANKLSTGNITFTPFVLYSYNKSELDLHELGYSSFLTVDRNFFSGVKAVIFSPPFVHSMSAGGNIRISDFDLENEFSKTDDDRISGFRFQSSYFYDVNRIFTLGGEFYKHWRTIEGTYTSSGETEEFKEKTDYSEKDIFFQFQYSGEILRIITGFWGGYKKVWVVDPRLLAELDFKFLKAKFGAGEMSQLKENYGELYWLRADHFSLELERPMEKFLLRVSGFLKRYGDSALCYGVEGLVKSSRFQIGAGWLHARDTGSVPLDYEIPFKITSFISFPILGWDVGLKFNFANGRPYTPIVGTDSSGTNPIYGDHNSERLPDIVRLDLRLSRLLKLPFLDGFFFIEVYNLTNHRNVSGYVYSKDYERKQDIRYFDRMFVAGLSLKL